MPILVRLTIALVLFSSVCSAQTVTPGSFQVSGVTAVLVNRQTISTLDAGGRLAGDVNLTSANVGFEGTYYITPHFGIGGLITYQRLSIEAPDRNAVFDVSGGFFGPLAQVRLPLGDRSEFVIVGSDGGTKSSLVNQNTGVSNNVASTVDGRYWLAGGGLSFAVRPNASFDLGVRYQSSTFSGGSQSGKPRQPVFSWHAFSLYIH